MITGFTGTGLNELVGALSRSKYGNHGGGSRSTQPMPKMDTVQFSARSQELSAATVPDRPAVERPFVAERPVATEKPAQPAAEPSLMDRIKAAFFTQAGDDGFDAMADLNADGKVNSADLRALRAPDTAPDPKVMYERMQSSIFNREGSEGFDAELDMNSDGVINFADMAMLRAQMDAAVTRPPPAPVTPAAPVVPDTPVAAAQLDPATQGTRDEPVSSPPVNEVSVESIRSAFFSRAGEEAFNAAADLNGDGRINFADLAQFNSD